MGDRLVKVMIKYRICLFYFTCLIVFATNLRAADQQKQNKLDSSIGWLHGNCLAIKNKHLDNNTKLKVVELDAQSSFLATILRNANNADECYPLQEDRKSINLQSGNSFYLVSSTKPIEIGIGIISNNLDGNNLENKLLDSNQDGRKDTFSYCYTSEGISFNIWKEAAHKSALIWSGYYYLGYDTEENCPPQPKK